MSWGGACAFVHRKITPASSNLTTVIQPNTLRAMTLNDIFDVISSSTQPNQNNTNGSANHAGASMFFESDDDEENDPPIHPDKLSTKLSTEVEQEVDTVSLNGIDEEGWTLQNGEEMLKCIEAKERLDELEKTVDNSVD